MVGPSGRLDELTSRFRVRLNHGVASLSNHLHKIYKMLIPPPTRLGFLNRFITLAKALMLPAALYLFAISFIFLTNAFLLGTFRHAFGHAGHTLLTAVGLAGFFTSFARIDGILRPR